MNFEDGLILTFSTTVQLTQHTMPSRFDIEHVTEINAPIERVWDALIAIDNWNWNKWTKLEAKSATTGESGVDSRRI